MDIDNYWMYTEQVVAAVVNFYKRIFKLESVFLLVFRQKNIIATAS